MSEFFKINTDKLKWDNHYCPLVYKGLYIEKAPNNQIAVAPCCLTASPDLNVTKVDKINFEKESGLQYYRDRFNQGNIPDACFECDIRNSNSLRENTMIEFQKNGWMKDPHKVELIKLNYNCEPICNAKCIMCGPWYSSAWAQEEHQFGNTEPPRPQREFRHNNSIRDLDMSKLRHIYFNGGEPLMTREHITVLEAVHDLSRVEIEYNTNGSIYPTAEIFALWKKAKKVTLNISIDGIEDCFEYVRYPLKWKKVENNVRAFVNDGLIVRCSYTYGVYNIMNIKQTKQWFESICNGGFHTHPVIEPAQFYVGNANIELKQKFLDYIGHEEWGKEIVDQIKSNWNRVDDSWQKRLDILDKRRGTNWREVFGAL